MTFLLVLIFWIAESTIFHSFTNNEEVYLEFVNTFPYWYIATIVGGFPGVAEGGYHFFCW
jgi:hypothetical protein